MKCTERNSNFGAIFRLSKTGGGRCWSADCNCWRLLVVCFQRNAVHTCTRNISLLHYTETMVDSFHYLTSLFMAIDKVNKKRRSGSCLNVKIGSEGKRKCQLMQFSIKHYLFKNFSFLLISFLIFLNSRTGVPKFNFS